MHEFCLLYKWFKALYICLIPKNIELLLILHNTEKETLLPILGRRKQYFLLYKS